MRLVTVATAIGGILAATLAFGSVSKQATAAMAWCAINADGTVNLDRSFRCNAVATETQQLGTGIYEVDFTPLSTDIRFFPRSAQADTLTFGVALPRMIGTSDRAGDSSSIFVITRDQSGAAADTPFFLVID